MLKFPLRFPKLSLFIGGLNKIMAMLLMGRVLWKITQSRTKENLLEEKEKKCVLLVSLLE